MKQRLEAMETQLQAQSAELTDARAMVAAQQVQIEETQTIVSDERDAVSALSSFLESTDISGFAAAGWNYANPNTDVDDEVGEGSSFNLDQAWITMNKASTADSRGGFNLELTAGSFDSFAGGGSGDNLGVHAASVSYLAPLGNGLLVDAGILNTALGAEVANLNGNWQINRGVVWGIQPVTNTGMTLTYGLTDNISVMMGVLNDPFGDLRNQTPETDPGTVGMTSSASYSQDNFGLNVGFNYGGGGGSLEAVCEKVTSSSDCGTGALGDRSGILDVVATLDISDNIGLWVNYDYSYTDDSDEADIFSIQAIAIAGRVEVMEATGISGRIEYADLDLGSTYGGGGGDVQTYTVTVDRTLTSGLTAKFEYLYETLSIDGVPGDSSASLINAMLMYEF